MGRRGGSCTIDKKSGKKSATEVTQELGAQERRDKKMKVRADDAKKQAAAIKKTGSEVSNA